jgi:hypothetical protein
MRRQVDGPARSHPLPPLLESLCLNYAIYYLLPVLLLPLHGCPPQLYLPTLTRTMTHTHVFVGTVEDLEAAKGDDEEEEEKEEQSANKFMKKSKSAPKGKKSFSARCSTVLCLKSDTARDMGWDEMG